MIIIFYKFSSFANCTIFQREIGFSRVEILIYIIQFGFLISQDSLNKSVRVGVINNIHIS